MPISPPSLCSMSPKFETQIPISPEESVWIDSNVKKEKRRRRSDTERVAQYRHLTGHPLHQNVVDVSTRKKKRKMYWNSQQRAKRSLKGLVTAISTILQIQDVIWNNKLKFSV